MNKWKRIAKEEKGQSLVEFALLLPVLMLIILGIIEFGFMFNAKITLNSAAREGARVYAVSKDEAEVNQAVNDTLGYLGSGDSIVKTYKDLDATSGIKMASVTITKEVDFLTNFFDALLGESIVMESEASMRVEYQLAITGGE
jgi:Flp pilus assembly protein TadG